MLVFTLVFNRFAGLDSGAIPYPLFAYSGLLLWTFFSVSVSSGTNSLIGNTSLVTKVYFPRAFIPAAAVGAGLVDFSVGAVLLAALAVYYGVNVTWGLLLLPVFVGLAAVLALAVGMIASALTVRYRDLRHALPFLFNSGCSRRRSYTRSAAVPARWRWLLALNPLDGRARRLPRVAHGEASTGVSRPCRFLAAPLLLGARLLRLQKTRRHFRRHHLRRPYGARRRQSRGRSKRYSIGALHPAYATFREVLVDAVARACRRLGRGGDGRGARHIWALDGVNIEVRRGEILGIVGRNGAGKSTLLKILSRITRPSEGSVEIHGRVGSLLEVGTGFHPDLTGRENIFLNGAILGMRRVEIKEKFDEIVAFSELEKFVETPVKFYSSGMYVRLAFSVAAHLEPEILIMDEVLAVGDMAFQQKCLDKMNEVRRQGRTIFFVSHNLPAITRLCKRAVLLEGGRLVAEGSPQEVVNRYLSGSWKAGAERVWEGDDAPGDARRASARARACSTSAARPTAAVDVRRPFSVELTYDVLEDGHALDARRRVLQRGGRREVFTTHDTGERVAQARAGRAGATRAPCASPATFSPRERSSRTFR